MSHRIAQLVTSQQDRGHFLPGDSEEEPSFTPLQLSRVLWGSKLSFPIVKASKRGQIFIFLSFGPSVASGGKAFCFKIRVMSTALGALITPDSLTMLTSLTLATCMDGHYIVNIAYSQTPQFRASAPLGVSIPPTTEGYR